jgi:hypothetical protein
MLAPYDYVVVRVVPRVEREEFVNVGVILYCPTHRFLAAHIACDAARLQALAPNVDVAIVQEHLAVIPRVCAGEVEAEEMRAWSQAERFHWLAAPRNTIIQTSPLHNGLCADPAGELARLLATLVTEP